MKRTLPKHNVIYKTDSQLDQRFKWKTWTYKTFRRFKRKSCNQVGWGIPHRMPKAWSIKKIQVNLPLSKLTYQMIQLSEIQFCLFYFYFFLRIKLIYPVTFHSPIWMCLSKKWKCTATQSLWLSLPDLLETKP